MDNTNKGRKRQKLADKTVEVLEEAFSQGLRSTAKQFHDWIARIAAITELEVATVKTWIGNRHKADQKPDAQDQPKRLVRPPIMREPNMYNMFCSDFFKSEPCQGLTFAEKSRKATERYRTLSQVEKDAYKERAKELASPSQDTLEKSQVESLVRRHMTHIQGEFEFLEQLGCHAMCVIVDNNGALHNLGTRLGLEFLDGKKGADVLANFLHSATGAPGKSSFDKEAVRQLFNRKYGEFLGLAYSKEVPYSKGIMELGGVPGIKLRKPGDYGQRQINRIMECQDNLYLFLRQSSTAPVATAAPSAMITAPSASETITSLAPSVTIIPSATLTPLASSATSASLTAHASSSTSAALTPQARFTSLVSSATPASLTAHTSSSTSASLTPQARFTSLATSVTMIPSATFSATSTIPITANASSISSSVSDPLLSISQGSMVAIAMFGSEPPVIGKVVDVGVNDIRIEYWKGSWRGKWVPWLVRGTAWADTIPKTCVILEITLKEGKLEASTRAYLKDEYLRLGQSSN